MTTKPFQNIFLIALTFGLAIALGGCASSGGDTSSDEGSTASADAKSDPALVPVPASSKLAKIEAGMSQQQVRKAIGEPDDIRGYPTGKNWIPWYFGGDTYRMDWTYSGVGKVVFSNSNRWTRNMIVRERHHNPDQP